MTASRATVTDKPRTLLTTTRSVRLAGVGVDDSPLAACKLRQTIDPESLDHVRIELRLTPGLLPRPTRHQRGVFSITLVGRQLAG